MLVSSLSQSFIFRVLGLFELKEIHSGLMNNSTSIDSFLMFNEYPLRLVILFNIQHQYNVCCNT